MAGAQLPFNPFPAQATTAIDEGAFVDSYRRWVKTTPTLDMEPVERLRMLAARYRNSFDVFGDSADGKAVFVHGEHGSGKTHAIRAAIGEACVRGDDPIPLPLYAKMSGHDFLATYRLLMAQISAEELTDIALRFLGSFNERGPLSAAGRKELQRNPTLLFELFDKHLIERGLLLQAQADKVDKWVRDETNFQRALTYLLEPDLQDTAFKWIVGHEVRDSELRRLGISRPIQTIEQCRYGLQMLTLLCERAKRPMILVLDQAEKFLIDTSGATVAESLGLLHSLSESIPTIGGMLIVAASEEAWDRLPTDLRQRFGANDVACKALDPGEAIQLVGVYVRAVLNPADRDNFRAPWPFTDTAIHELLRVSGGNMRAVLQLAWLAVEGMPDGAEFIGEIKAPGDAAILDPAVVELVVRRILWKLGPVRPAEQDGFDLAVAVSEQTRLLVRLTQAKFYLGESLRAEQDALARLKSVSDPSDSAGFADRYVLVIVGYASAKVLGLLSGLYDDVIVYRDEVSAAAAFHRIAHTARPGPRGTADQITTLVEALSRLTTDRQHQEDRLERDISELAAARTIARTSTRFEELIRRWSSVQQDILAEIERMRTHRARAELDELYRINQASQLREAILKLRFVVPTLGLTAALLLPGGWMTIAPWLGVVLFAVAGIAFGAAAIQLNAVAMSWIRSRAARPGSLAEAERMARERAHKPISSGRFRPNLSSSDPYFRLGQILLVGQELSQVQLRAALGGERVGILRRMLADKLGRRLRHEPFKTAKLAVSADLRELPYVMQHLRIETWSDSQDMSAPIRLLLGMANRLGEDTSEQRPSSDLETCVELILRAREGLGALGAVYTEGIDYIRFTRACAEVTDSQMKQMERLVSPRDGLGGYDHLELAPEVEQLYLFIRKLTYLRDGGAQWS